MLNTSNNKSFKLAFAAIEAALAIAVLMCTGIITIGTYALSALAGIVLIPVAIEVGFKYSFSSYLIASIISLIIAPDKEAVFCFIMLLGYYPTLKIKIELLRKRWLRAVIKLGMFNASMVAVFYLSIAFLGMDRAEFELFGVYIPYVFLIIGNFVFILYDFALTDLIRRYVMDWRHRIKLF